MRRAVNASSGVTLPSRPQWLYTPTDVQSQAYDPAAANTVLDQSGYASKDPSGIRLDKNGQPIVLNIITLPEETGSVDTGKLIAAQLQQIGIGVKLQSMSDKQIENNNWYTGDFDAYVWGWGGDPDPNFILSIFITSQCLGWSDGCYSNPTYDKMFAHQSTLLDHTARVAYIQKMQQFIYDQIPEIVLNYPRPTGRIGSRVGSPSPPTAEPICSVGGISTKDCSRWRRPRAARHQGSRPSSGSSSGSSRSR